MNWQMDTFASKHKPIVSTRSSDRNFVKDRKTRFDTYDECYTYYFSVFLPSVYGDRFHDYVRHELVSRLNGLISIIELIKSLHDKKQLNDDDLRALIENCKDMVWVFRAIVDASADYEKELFR